MPVNKEQTNDHYESYKKYCICFSQEYRNFMKANRETELSIPNVENSEFTEVQKDLCDILSETPDLDLFGYFRMSTNTEASERFFSNNAEMVGYNYIDF